MLIEWKEEYSVNIKLIDDQHKVLVRIMNQLNNNLSRNDFSDDTGNLLDELVEYSNNHFSIEENYFDQYEYPEASKHKEYHDMFREKISFLKGQFYSKKEIETSFETIDFLEDWFIKHVNIEDRKYARFLNDRGVF